MFIIFSSHTFSQEKCIVKGNVTINGGDLKNVKITLYKDSNKESVRNLSSNGKFSYNLNFGYDYIFEFSKPEFVTKQISVSTYVPQDILESDSRFPPTEFSIELFRFFPGVDLSVFDHPTGMIMYNSETDLIETDLSYQTEIEDELKRIKKEMEEKQKAYLAELARKNAEFDAAIKNADLEFKQKNYNKSKSFYSQASTLKPNEIYPQNQIAKIDELLLSQKDELEAQRLIDEKYKGFIELADKSFETNNYEEAKLNYDLAIEVNSSEKYPKDQLAKIKKLVLTAKLNAANEAKNLAVETAKQKKYDAFILDADKAFDLKQYSASKLKYNSALKVKPNEAYPQEQIQLINDKLDYERQLKAVNAKFVAEQKILKVSYNKIIKLADNQFKRKDYTKALASYQQALELGVDETYPQTQIELVNAAILRDKALAENKEKQKEIDTQYELLIDSGDKQLKNGEYVDAKQNYTEALNLKPDESHPKTQLLKIESLIAHQAKLLADKEAREKKYADLISMADSQMNNGEFDKALNNYAQALNIKPKATYINDQVKKAKQGKINRKRKQEEDIKNALKQKLRFEKYDELIAKGDRNLEGKKYYDSRDNFQDALKIKPNEKYPKEQLNKLEDLMAKDLQQADALREFDIKYKDLISTANSQLNTGELELAKVSYRNAAVMKPDENYPKSQLIKLDGLIAAANKIKAEEKILNDKYSAFLDQADKEFEAGDFKAAIKNYELASDLKSKEYYPKSQITKAEEILKENSRIANKKSKAEKANRVLEEKYSKAIKEADSNFDTENYKNASSNYTQALKYKANDVYATGQITKIEILIAEKEKNEAAAELLAKNKAALEKEFQSELTDANKLFKNGNLTEALDKYESAFKLVKENPFVIEQIKLIKERLKQDKFENEKNLAIKEEYEDYISSADKLFAEQNMKPAKEKYQQALDLKYKNSYPQNQIKLIRESLVEQDKIDKKKNRVEREFENLIMKADSYFTKETYTLARHNYKEALRFKPKDTYVNAQLRKIKDILKANAITKEDAVVSLNSNAFNANILKKKEAEYKVFVSKGELAIKNKSLGKARAYFEKALDLFDRDFVKDKLAEINVLKFSFKSEKDRVNYEKWMDLGDNALSNRNYSGARHYYKKASLLAADRSIAQSKLDEIEELILVDKQKAIDKEFIEWVKKGDEALASGNLSVAKFYFIKALKLKPNDSIQKDKLENIKKSLK